MRAREFVETLANKYGLEIAESWDKNIDIMLPEGKTPPGLLRDLQQKGFKYSFPEEGEITEVHIHAPHRKEKSWYDRGWDWEVEDTRPSPVPGEIPYYGEDYLGRSGFSEN